MKIRKWFLYVVMSFFVLVASIFAFVFPFFLHDEFPGIAYKGDRKISVEEVITFEELVMRDMHISYMCADEETEYSKCYLIKNPDMKLDALCNRLGSFCVQELEQNADGKKKLFLFYRTSRKMPWFWNESISSLDGIPSDLIGVFSYSEDNTLISCDVYKRSSSFFHYGKIKQTLGGGRGGAISEF